MWGIIDSVVENKRYWKELKLNIILILFTFSRDHYAGFKIKLFCIYRTIVSRWEPETLLWSDFIPEKKMRCNLVCLRFIIFLICLDHWLFLTLYSYSSPSSLIQFNRLHDSSCPKTRDSLFCLYRVFTLVEINTRDTPSWVHSFRVDVTSLTQSLPVIFFRKGNGCLETPQIPSTLHFVFRFHFLISMKIEHSHSRVMEGYTIVR